MIRIFRIFFIYIKTLGIIHYLYILKVCVIFFFLNLWESFLLLHYNITDLWFELKEMYYIIMVRFCLTLNTKAIIKLFFAFNFNFFFLSTFLFFKISAGQRELANTLNFPFTLVAKIQKNTLVARCEMKFYTFCRAVQHTKKKSCDEHLSDNTHLLHLHNKTFCISLLLSAFPSSLLSPTIVMVVV